MRPPHWRLCTPDHALRLTAVTLPLVGVLAGLLGNWVWPHQVVVLGQGPAVVLPVALSVIGLVAGMASICLEGRHGLLQLPKTFVAAIAALLLLWTFAFIQSIASGTAWNYTALCVPALIAVVALVKLQNRDLQFAAAALGSGTVLVALSGIWHNGFATSELWAKPFTHENYAGPALALSAIFLVLAGVRALLPFGILATLLAFASGSRTAVLAILVGAMVTSLWWGVSRPRSTRSWMVIYVGGTALALTVILGFVFGDRSLNGRTTVWSAFLLAWQNSGAPAFGLGNGGLHSLMETGRLPYWSHGHNLLVDTFVRLGWPGLFLGCVALVCALVTVFRVRHQPLWPVTSTSAIVVIAALETPTYWLYLTLPSCWLALAITASSVVRPDCGAGVSREGVN